MSSRPDTAVRLKRFGPNPFASINQRLAELAADGKAVIRLDVGNPDMPPPSAVVESLAVSASDPDHHGYSSYRGDPGFRQAIADYYARRFGVSLDPETEVLPLIGSKEGIANLSLAYLDRGDAAMVPELAYPTYAAAALMAGAETITVPMRREDGYRVSFDEPIPGIERAKLLWINYPNNPTGAVAPREFYARALAFCDRHGLLLCSDNPYSDVTFDGFRAPSVLEAPGAKERAVEFISFSKTYNMAGWRLGACVGNRDVLKNLLHMKGTVDSAHFRAIYDAGSTALLTTPQSWIDERNARYARRRDRLIAALPEIGLEAETPKGSLYVWAHILNGMTDREYTTAALNSALVSITPGTTYGQAGTRYVRFSLGIADERLDHAIRRLRAWYSNLSG